MKSPSWAELGMKEIEDDEGGRNIQESAGK